MFQTPFSDRIRNEAGVATLAVGNIYEPDHVNSILMAGRADLVCLARPHLADPYWTLHAAADLHYDGVNWPKPYWRGRDQLNRLKSRAPRRMIGEGLMGVARRTGTRWSPAAAAASAPPLPARWPDAGAALSPLPAGDKAPLDEVARKPAEMRVAIVADVTREADCEAMIEAARASARADRYRRRQCRHGRERAVRARSTAAIGSA